MTNIINYLTIEEKKLIKEKTYGKDEIIFMENEKCQSIGIVISGHIDIVSYSFSGEEIIYNSLFENEIFGNNLIFSDAPYYRGIVISRSKSKVAFIDKNDLLMLLQQNTPFLQEYLRIQSNFGKRLNSQIKLLSFDTAVERFNYYLFINNKSITYKNVSRLAEILHLKRETLSRLLSRLEKDKKIKRFKNKIVSLD